ncbi:NAD(P)H-dependent oxidoreductase [Mycobacteroides abscessus]|uniref:NAD(P)H-dependent oxidoreductase n=1 Tax=Mycobacteroides abscessus TaxID=36809 RepID=UPI00030C1136|nr:NAD(P)H-dependent oxidoreductase [Mycobacteroides abscessus]
MQNGLEQFLEYFRRREVGYNMNVFLVYAHPSTESLTGSLKDIAVSQLKADGHDVQVSDLYQMGWKAQADFSDLGPATGHPYQPAAAVAYENGSMSPDIVAEQEKLLWAEVVLLCFPLWWYSMPAILKGWVDRVFSNGFAYGGVTQKRPVYGGGVLTGRRAMLIVNVGGRESSYTDRGITGPMDHVLYPINHGILYFIGMDVLPPFVTYGTDHMTVPTFHKTEAQLRRRLREMREDKVIPFRALSGGDYDHSMRLLPQKETSDERGFDLHISR